MSHYQARHVEQGLQRIAQRIVAPLDTVLAASKTQEGTFSFLAMNDFVSRIMSYVRAHETTPITLPYLSF